MNRTGSGGMVGVEMDVGINNNIEHLYTQPQLSTGAVNLA